MWPSGCASSACAIRGGPLQPRTRFVAGFLGAVNWIGGVGVRPEAIRISRTDPGVAARVLRTVFLGNCMHIVTDVATVEVSCGAPCFQEGDAVHLSWESADELRFHE